MRASGRRARRGAGPRQATGRAAHAREVPHRSARASWATVTGTGAAASLALAILVLVCAFVAVAVPRASLGYRTAVLRQALRAAPSSQTTVLADATITGLAGGSSLGTAQLTSAQTALAAGLHQDGLPLAPAAQQWAGMATGTTPFTGGRPL